MVDGIGVLLEASGKVRWLSEDRMIEIGSVGWVEVLVMVHLEL